MADIPASGSSRAVGTGSVLLTVGGLAAAFGVASCCGLPFLLATAGLGTAWLTGFALLAAPHRTVLLIVGAVCLAGGAVLVLAAAADCHLHARRVLLAACRQKSHARRICWLGWRCSISGMLTHDVSGDRAINHHMPVVRHVENGDDANRMPASFSMTAPAAERCCVRSPATAACFAPSERVPCPPIQEASGKGACCR